MKENKLIAEFMGYEVKHGKCYSPKYNDGTIAPMQFDRSWDWLMPVAEKIYKERGLDDEIVLMIRDSVAELNIESMYKTIVEFIKQYNNDN